MTSAEALEETPFPTCVQVEPCRAIPRQHESWGPQLPLGVEVDPSWQQEVFQFHSLVSVEVTASEKPVDLALAKCQLMSASSPAAEEASSERSWCPGPSSEVVEIGQQCHRSTETRHPPIPLA